MSSGCQCNALCIAVIIWISCIPTLAHFLVNGLQPWCPLFNSLPTLKYKWVLWLERMYCIYGKSLSYEFHMELSTWLLFDLLLLGPSKNRSCLISTTICLFSSLQLEVFCFSHYLNTFLLTFFLLIINGLCVVGPKQNQIFISSFQFILLGSSLSQDECSYGISHLLHLL